MSTCFLVWLFPWKQPFLLPSSCTCIPLKVSLNVWYHAWTLKVFMLFMLELQAGKCFSNYADIWHDFANYAKSWELEFSTCSILTSGFWFTGWRSSLEISQMVEGGWLYLLQRILLPSVRWLQEEDQPNPLPRTKILHKGSVFTLLLQSCWCYSSLFSKFLIVLTLLFWSCYYNSLRVESWCLV